MVLKVQEWALWSFARLVLCLCTACTCPPWRRGGGIEGGRVRRKLHKTRLMCSCKDRLTRTIPHHGISPALKAIREACMGFPPRREQQESPHLQPCCNFPRLLKVLQQRTDPLGQAAMPALKMLLTPACRRSMRMLRGITSRPSQRPRRALGRRTLMWGLPATTWLSTTASQSSGSWRDPCMMR